jgi:hypothetical protein
VREDHQTPKERNAERVDHVLARRELRSFNAYARANLRKGMSWEAAARAAKEAIDRSREDT